eukprot:jgi/Bigna1/137705/aug1.40_g12413
MLSPKATPSIIFELQVDGEKDKEEDEVVEDKVEGQGVNNNSEVEADSDGDAPCKVCGLHHGGDPYNCPNDLCKICLKPGHMSWDCTEIIPKSRKPLSSLAVCYSSSSKQHIPTTLSTVSIIRDDGVDDHQACFRKGHVNCQKRPAYPRAEALPAGCLNCGEPRHGYATCPKPKQRSLHSRSSPHTSRFECFACGGVGHKAADCPKGPACFNCNQRATMHCYVCGRNDHTASQCFRRHRQKYGNNNNSPHTKGGGGGEGRVDGGQQRYKRSSRGERNQRQEQKSNISRLNEDAQNGTQEEITKSGKKKKKKRRKRKRDDDTNIQRPPTGDGRSKKKKGRKRPKSQTNKGRPGNIEGSGKKNKRSRHRK